MRRKPIAPTTLVAILIAVTTCGADEDEQDPPTISVSGQGKISAAPDVASRNAATAQSR